MLAYLKYATTHRAAVTAALTVLSIALAHLGVAVPHVPHELVTALLAILTGYFGVTTDEAAYIEGWLDAVDDAASTAATDATAA